MRGSIGVKYSNQETYDATKHSMEYWTEDIGCLVFPIILKGGTIYGITLEKHIFQSIETYPMLKDFEIRFKTKE